MAKNTASKNIRRRAKINAIYNITFDLKLANQYRDRSWNEIERLFGVKDRTLQTKKEMPKNIDSYLQQTETYREYLSQTELLGTFKISKDFIKAETQKDIFKTWKASRIAEERKSSEKTKREIEAPIQNKKVKDQVWSFWSTPKDTTAKKSDYYMPEQFDTLAANINMKQGLDPNASFGYAVIYYSYTRDQPIAEIMDNVKITNKFLETYENPYKVNK